MPGRTKKIEASLETVSQETLLLTTLEGRRYLVNADDVRTAVQWQPADRLEIEPSNKELGTVIIRRLAVLHPALPELPNQEIRATVI